MDDGLAYKRSLTELQVAANYGCGISALVLKRLDDTRREFARILFAHGTSRGGLALLIGDDDGDL